MDASGECVRETHEASTAYGHPLMFYPKDPMRDMHANTHDHTFFDSSSLELCLVRTVPEAAEKPYTGSCA